MKKSGLLFLLIVIALNTFAQMTDKIAMEHPARKLYNARKRELVLDALYGAQVLHNNRLLVQNSRFGGRMGIIDYNGDTILPCIYHAITYVQGDLFIVQDVNNKYGVVDVYNNEVIPIKYKLVQHWINDLFFVSSAEPPHHWGIVNAVNEQKVDFIYNWALHFNNNLAAVTQGAYWGIIDTDFKQLTPYTYQYVYSTHDSIVISYQYGGFTAFALNGDTIVPPSRNYGYIAHFVDGYAFFKDKNGLWGIIDRAGKEIVPAKYHYVNAPADWQNPPLPVFINGLCFVSLKDTWSQITTGAINTAGETVMPFEYRTLRWLNGNNIVAGRPERPQLSPVNYGIIDVNGREVLPFKYPFLGQANGDHIVAGKTIVEGKGKNQVGVNKFGIIDFAGNMIIPFDYWEIKEIFDDCIIAREDMSLLQKGKGYGVADFAGNVLIPFKYGDITRLNDSLFFLTDPIPFRHNPHGYLE